MNLQTQRRASAARNNGRGRNLSVRAFAYISEEKKTPPPPASKPEHKNQLEALKSMSVVVADTGELDLVKKYHPQDCTTNPSLVLKAVQNEEYAHLLKEAFAQRSHSGGSLNPARPFAEVADILAVNIGAEMLKVIPGRVSTEVDAHLSYDKIQTIDKALRLVDLYAAKGIDPSRLYIKLASTWQGIEACQKLESQGINCNMTLLFSFAQAAACADVGATLVSPFVGRIMDWYKDKEKRVFAPHEDPGVKSVQRIYKYFKAHNLKTVIMAASFRNLGEIQQLAGCDKITVSPALLAELEACSDPLPRLLAPGMPSEDNIMLHSITEREFNELHGVDQMAVDKLREGINGFAADQTKLEQMVAALVQ